MKGLSGITASEIVRSTVIEGQAFPVHEFTSEVWARIVKPIREPNETETTEEAVKHALNIVVAGIEGKGYTPTTEDREKIKSLLPNGVIREYIHRLCQLNDFGVDAVRGAEKNYAAAQSDDTK